MTRIPSPQSTRAASVRPYARPIWLMLVVIVGIALCMRGPFIAVAPLASTLRRDLGLSDVQFGILTGIPVLCFAVFSPASAWLGRRLGGELSVSLTVLGVALGAAVRSLGTGWALFAGTLVLGAAITIGNIVMPLIVRRDVPPEKQSMATGVYSGTLSTSAFLASIISAPLAEWLGWQLSLGLTVVLALSALAFWTWAVGAASAFRPAVPDPARRSMSRVQRREAGRLRGGVLWATVALSIGFAGQACSYFGITAWLPSYLHDTIGLAATQAGAGSSIFQGVGILGAFGTPLLMRWFGGRRATMIIGSLWVTAPLGLLLAPQLWWFWSISGGFAQGGGFMLVLSAIIRLNANQAQRVRISALVQGTGYLFAGMAPTVVGSVHVLAGSWQVALLVPLATTCTFLVFVTWGVTLADRLATARPQP